MSDLTMLFGVPIHKTKITDEYNKKEILDIIEKNYKIDPRRNAWNNNSNLHHTFDDTKNEKFLKPNFSELIPIYNQKITAYFNTIFNDGYKFKWRFTNYTCMKKDQFMEKHNHPDSDFTGIHYIKFNEGHTPTVYHNTSIWSDYIQMMRIFNLSKKVSDNTNNSYLFDLAKIEIEEDDFVISPGIVFHSVPMSKVDDLRVTIIIDINIVT